MFPASYFPSSSGMLYLDGATLKYRHADGSVLSVMTVADPSAVPGLQLWLKADAIAGLANGALVTTWNDASGHGRAASQGLGNRMPIFQADRRNGLPALRFDGVDDCLDGPPGSWQTAIAVANASNTPTAHMALWGNASGGADLSIRRFFNGPDYSHNNSGDFAPTFTHRINGVATNRVVNGTWHVLTCLSPTVRAFPYRVGGTGQFTPGRTWSGEIAELLVYDRVLDESQILNVERYLALKYAIPHG